MADPTHPGDEAFIEAAVSRARGLIRERHGRPETTIEVCRRPDEYGEKKFHAQFRGEPGYWGCGRSIDEAVGSLLRAHYYRLGISVEFPESVLR